MPRLTNRVALVSGAGSGIGAATAVLLAERGALVCAADLNLAGAEETKAQVIRLGGGALAYALDVRDEAQWESAFTELEREAGRVDIMVNCAGISAASPLADTSFDEWSRVLSTNLDGAFLGTKHAVRAMRENGGAIVHVGSASGLRAAAGAAAYSVSKAGLGMLVRAAAKECREAGLDVRINAVSPAGVRTPLWRSMPFFQDLVTQTGSEVAAFEAMAGEAGGRFAEPDEVARAILFLVSDDARHINGVELPFDGGYIL